MEREIIEGALFLVGRQISIEELSRVSGINEEKVIEILKELQEKYGEDSGIKLVLAEGKAQLIVNPKVLPKIAHLSPYRELSKGQLKVLSIVAFKNQVTQSQIVKSLGNKAYSYIKELEKKGFIKGEKFGKTKLLKTTKLFKEYFGIEE